MTDQPLTPTLLDLSAIVTDAGTQPRAGLDTPTLERYTELARRPYDLPPVVVFHDGSRYILADGFHRVEAYKRAGRTRIHAEVHQGTARDAIYYSAGANKTHGLPASLDDKRRAATRLLQDDQWRLMSDRAIGDHVGLSPTTVGKLRADLYPPTVQNGQSDAPDTRIGRDGREVNVANIGRKTEARDAFDGLTGLIIVSTEKDDREVEAALYGDFAVHPSVSVPGYWTVTYIPARRAVAAGIKQQPAAVRVALAVRAHVEANGVDVLAMQEAAKHGDSRYNAEILAFNTVIRDARTGEGAPEEATVAKNATVDPEPAPAPSSVRLPPDAFEVGDLVAHGDEEGTILAFVDNRRLVNVTLAQGKGGRFWNMSEIRLVRRRGLDAAPEADLNPAPEAATEAMLDGEENAITAVADLNPFTKNAMSGVYPPVPKPGETPQPAREAAFRAIVDGGAVGEDMPDALTVLKIKGLRGLPYSNAGLNINSGESFPRVVFTAHGNRNEGYDAALALVSTLNCPASAYFSSEAMIAAVHELCCFDAAAREAGADLLIHCAVLREWLDSTEETLHEMLEDAATVE